MQHCCILQYDFITVFITAGVRREPPLNAGTINIIVCSSEGMEDAALLESVMVIAEAKAEALQAMDLPLTGTPTDAVIVGCEGTIRPRYAGQLTDPGLRIRESVLHGIPEAVRRYDAGRSICTLLIFHLQPFQRRALGGMDPKRLPLLSLPLDKMMSNIQEIRARGGRIIAVAREGDTELPKVAERTIFVPPTLDPLVPIIAVLPLQLLAYHIAVLRGCDVDRPRNLAKSVTVE